MKAQRLRFRYRVTGAGCALTQRELIHAWEQAVADAGLSLAYSEGKRRTAQIAMAAPLPQNVTSDGELVEMYLAEPVAPEEALEGMRGRLPAGIEVCDVQEIGVQAPSLQSQLRWAEYEAELPPEVDCAGACRAVEELLKARTLPAEYRRETRVKRYDLRPLVLDLRVEESTGRLVLKMRLRAEPEMTGRADQVLLALGLPEASHIHRLRLYVDEVQAALLGYRRANEPEA